MKEKFQSIENKNSNMGKAEKAYKTLRNRIFSGYYLPREHLVESMLSKDLEISRMAVRDIFKRLVLNGLVEIQPYKGCTVANISVQQIYETYQVEAFLEGSAAFLSSTRISDKQIRKLENLIKDSKKVKSGDIKTWEENNHKIHQLINRGCGNSKLIKMIAENVRFSTYWFIMLSTPGQIPKNNNDHELILKAIKERNPYKARQCMEKHLLEAAEELRERLINTFPFAAIRDQAKSLQAK